MKHAKPVVAPLSPGELDQLPFVPTVDRLDHLLNVLSDRIERRLERTGKPDATEIECLRAAEKLIPKIEAIKELVEEPQPEVAVAV